MSTEALFRVRVAEEGKSEFRLLRLLPSRERLVVALREGVLEGLLALPQGSFRRLGHGEALVVPMAALLPEERRQVEVLGYAHTPRRPKGEIAAEVFFLQEEVPLVWVRLDQDGAGVVLEAFLEPEEAA
ncbi:hypothetical protein [Thermus sp.]|jgi:hypothetical protein|uniref:hypothetical protein n=1 Tax=Thermus sp. TaxID=275 RepID=UPI003D0BC8AE